MSRPNAAVPNAAGQWRSSVVRRLLEQDLLSGAIPLTNAEMPPLEVYNFRPEFAQIPYDSFPRRLKALRVQCGAKLNRSTVDAAAYNNDRRFDYQATFVALGLPRWDGSDAERLLKIDITNALHEQMAPKELYISRNEYQVFTLKVFRGHIHQEVKRRKFITGFYGR